MSLLAIAPIVRSRSPGTDRTASEFPAKSAGNSWQSCQSPEEPTIRNALLLQPDALAQTIVAQIVVERPFRGIQAPQFAIVRVALPNPERRVFQQRLPVHQKRLRVPEQRPQAVQDMEAVGIDVAPIVQRATVQPAHFREAVEAVP